MRIAISKDKIASGCLAAATAAETLRDALQRRGFANLILATGPSQFEMLAALVQQPGIAWQRVTVFHLDEYIGIPITHPASFRKYLRERFEEKLPERLAAFHYVVGDASDPQAECQRLGELIRRHPIDVACIGIGENGHLAFNDPPADFNTEEPYLVVALDEACRRQQLGEGWFKTPAEVPQRAISMSIRQILKSGRLVVTVPDARKAKAVRDALEGPFTNLCPASALRYHPDCHLFLDSASAALLTAPFIR
ncbi:MAG: glucosamine-6-phosphate deaminase [Planctomycetota bacterium]|nr:glucosamine-6-phosphate deaminase [Planctomycetota bacterium]